MNNFCAIGRLCQDPELKYTTNKTAVMSFTIAIDRKKKQDGTKETDFLPCVAWEKTAELISKYVTKGQRLGVRGCVESRKYTTQDGQNRTAIEILVQEIELIEKKAEPKPEPKQEIPEPGYFDPTEDDALPF